MALTKRQANRGKTTTRRKETNEQIMDASLKRYGYLSLRVSFAVKDEKAAYRGMKGESIVVRKVPCTGDVTILIGEVRQAIVNYIKGAGK
jgi:hypothetical protein